jgi:hypothetical protein
MSCTHDHGGHLDAGIAPVAEHEPLESKRPAALTGTTAPRPKTTGLQPLTPSAFVSSTTLPIFMHPQQSYYLTPAPVTKKDQRTRKALKTEKESKDIQGLKQDGGPAHGHEACGHRHSESQSLTGVDIHKEVNGKESLDGSKSGSQAQAGNHLLPPVASPPPKHFPPNPTQTPSPHHHQLVTETATLVKPTSKFQKFAQKWLQGESRPFAIMMLLTSVYLIAELTISVITG